MFATQKIFYASIDASMEDEKIRLVHLRIAMKVQIRVPIVLGKEKSVICNKPAISHFHFMYSHDPNSECKRLGS